MTWQRKTVISILLFVARLIEEEGDVKKELITLANNINYNAPKAT